LVTLGFAMARSNWIDDHDGAVIVEEPLAIKAVLDHLNNDEEGKNDYRRQMNNWLFMSQDDPSLLDGIRVLSRLYTCCEWHISFLQDPLRLPVWI